MFLEEFKSGEPQRQSSLENLSYLLRHQELWPQGFKWNFSRFETCAMGLCARVFDHKISSTKHVARLLNMPEDAAILIFCTSEDKPVEHLFNLKFLPPLPRKWQNITPEMVADCIDRYLTTCKKKSMIPVS